MVSGTLAHKSYVQLYSFSHANTVYCLPVVIYNIQIYVNNYKKASDKK